MTISPQMLEDLQRCVKALQEDTENNGGEWDSSGLNLYPFTLVHTHKCLYQSFEKRHVDLDNKLTAEQWEAYIDEYSNGFVQEAEDFKNETFSNFTAN